MGHTLNLDFLQNPLGKRVGGGFQTCRVGDGDRVHVEGRNGGPLCMQRVTHLKNLRPSAARVVDCYRCIKQMAFQSNAPMLDRSLTPGRGGSPRSHRMVPGGRQGPLVGARQPTKHGEPPWVTSMKGVDPFPRGSERHPTQTRLRGQVGAAGRATTREFRDSESGQALPRGYFPPITREEEIAMLAMRGPILPASVYAGKGKARGRKPSQKEVAAAIAAAGGMRANPRGVRGVDKHGMFQHIKTVQGRGGFYSASILPIESRDAAHRFGIVHTDLDGSNAVFLESGMTRAEALADLPRWVIESHRQMLSSGGTLKQYRGKLVKKLKKNSGHVETARNGRHFIRLANGQVRFVA